MPMPRTTGGALMSGPAGGALMRGPGGPTTGGIRIH